MITKQDAEQGENSFQEEGRVPLIQYHRDSADGEDQRDKSSKGHQWIVYLSTFVAVCGSYAFGACAGYSSPTESAIEEDLSLTLAQYSLFGSILTFGAMIGAITIGPIADFIGRKWVNHPILYEVICAFLPSVSVLRAQTPDKSVFVLLQKGALALDIGRLATGYGMGAFSYVVPVFIAEIAPKNLRGGLTTLNQVMICTGVSVSFIIGTVITWRALALSGIIPCAIVLLGLFLIPESPRWLAKVGKEKEFESALQKLRGKDFDISQEAAEIQDYIDTLQRLPKAKVLDLFQRRYLRSVTIGVGLMVCQQLGGINGICFYVTSIFEAAGFPSNLGTIIYACIQVSASGLVLGCMLTAISFFLKVHELALEASPILAVTGILVYIGSFSIGMGAVPWVVMSEIFPINIKGVAGGLATLVNWFIAWLVSYTYNYLMSWSSYGTFILYGAINALAIVFIVKVVPETKGRTLEEIQAAINA
ncbi:hypothetical protein RHGRI_002986 [Rhododendron griersonianum]|uniref:Major facilitator superfamily (MFS) profile domain-containing protein n=1 Tax=Rhododendron griersonianum TaxID=479676 RepID=A0AAV6LTU1_9ERIC|nr:hypothetical protein RHGRI_002986 [Rhododendron griersonianum]